MRRPKGLSCIVMSIVSLLAAGTQAQVDWGPLLGEKGAEPAHEAPPQEAPRPTVQPQGRRTPQGRHIVPAAPKPRTRTRVETPRSRRHAKRESTEEREYPAVPGGRP
jgi:hypothetical protein